MSEEPQIAVERAKEREFRVNIPESALKNISLQSLGLYVQLQFFSVHTKLEIEEAMDLICQEHGNLNVAIMMEELGDMKLIDLLDE
jgi:hypothetical protein